MSKGIRQVLQEKSIVTISTPEMGEVRVSIRPVSGYSALVATGLQSSDFAKALKSSGDGGRPEVDLAALFDGKTSEDIEKMISGGTRRTEYVLVEGVAAITDATGAVFKLCYSDEPPAEGQITVGSFRAIFGDHVASVERAIRVLSNMPVVEELEALGALEPDRFPGVTG